MINKTYSTFEKTLSGLSQGFHVRHIATFALKTCTPDEKVKAVFEQYPDFDQLPVKDSDRIIGVIDRNGYAKDMRVNEVMYRLNDGILVSAEQPLQDFIPLIAQPPFYRLVLQGAHVAGIVTRSDIHKLPVRLLGFALVTNLEILMKEIINHHWPEKEDWFSLLSTNRQAKVLDKRNLYAKKRMEPPLVDLTDFCDKRTILNKEFKLSKVFTSDLKEIEDLRNKLAHAGTYAEDETELLHFVDVIQKIRDWIDRLNQKL